MSDSSPLFPSEQHPDADPSTQLALLRAEVQRLALEILRLKWQLEHRPVQPRRWRWYLCTAR